MPASKETGRYFKRSRRSKISKLKINKNTRRREAYINRCLGSLSLRIHKLVSSHLPCIKPDQVCQPGNSNKTISNCRACKSTPPSSSVASTTQSRNSSSHAKCSPNSNRLLWARAWSRSILASMWTHKRTWRIFWRRNSSMLGGGSRRWILLKCRLLIVGKYKSSQQIKLWVRQHRFNKMQVHSLNRRTP